MKNDFEKLYNEYEKENPKMKINAGFTGDFAKKRPAILKYNPVKRGVIRGFGFGCLALVGTIVTLPAIALLSTIREQTHTNAIKSAKFTLAEKQQLAEESFKALNSVTYPSVSNFGKSQPIDTGYVTAMNSLAKEMFTAENSGDNFGFSPLSIFSTLDIASELANPEMVDYFNNLLGASPAVRRVAFKTNFENNFFIDDDSGMYTYNGLFLNKPLYVDDSVIDNLTYRYTEAFSFDYNNSSDQDKIVSWVNTHSPISEFSKNDLQIRPNERLDFYLFSSMYFKNKWYTPFQKNATSDGDFYNLDGSTSKTKFMNHKIYSAYIDNENYFTFYDYYQHSYSIQYILPQNGHTLNEVMNDEIINMSPRHNSENQNIKYDPIDLYVPKFTQTFNVDLTEYLKKTSAADIYDGKHDMFSKTLHLEGENGISYILKTKQMNKVAFDEDGTEVKSLSISFGGGSKAPGREGGYEIRLNEPFGYIIRDYNNCPIFMGKFTNVK